MESGWILFFIFISLALLISYYYKIIVGLFGEHWVKEELNKLNDNYKIVNNVMIKTLDGNTHQIDHIIVSKYGIFVIETKQYNGYICGNDYDKKWTIIAGRNKYYVNNPVHQNYGHVQSLKEILNITEDKIISIVCISSRARLNIKSRVVVNIVNLLTKIESYKREVIYDVDGIYNKILKLNIKDKKVRRMHKKIIHSIVKNKQY